MSYKFEPEWTDKISLPEKNHMICPTCGEIACNVDAVMDCLWQGSYYEPRHIPPQLIFTCGNEACPACDEDFYVGLEVVITASRPTYDPARYRE